MKQRSFPGSSTYLDISELLLKDLSPLIKPDVPHIEQYTINIQYAPLHTFLQTQDQQSESMTPLMTPFILDGIEVLDTPQHEDDLLLGIEYIDFGQFGFQAHHQQKSCHQKNKQRNKPFCDKQAGQYLIFDNELEMILADNEEDYDIFSEEYYSNFHQNSFESDFGSQQEIISPEDQQSQDNLFQDKNEEEKTESMNYENLPIQWLKANPKRKLIQNIQAIAVQYRNKEPEEVKSVLKKAIYPFIFEHQIYFLDQCFEQMKGNTSEMVEILIKGISQNFKRNIRGLTFEKRRIKLFKYMEKKRRRIWKKKVNYDCRKKVADGRLRIKGKFVTYEQACKQAGEKDGINAEELKFILEKTKSQAISQV